MEPDLWTYQGEVVVDDLQDFEVQANDGHIGKVDEATYDVGSSYIVVDTGPWILGKKVMLPAGVIESIDLDNRKVQIAHTKDEIRAAPEFDPDMYLETRYMTDLELYYGALYPGSGALGQDGLP